MLGQLNVETGGGVFNMVGGVLLRVKRFLTFKTFKTFKKVLYFQNSQLQDSIFARMLLIICPLLQEHRP